MSGRELVTDSVASALLPRLVRSFDTVVAALVLELRVPPSMEARPGSIPELALIAREARTTQRPGDSFTETLLGLAAQRGVVAPALDVAQFHQPLTAAVAAHRLPVRELTGAGLEAILHGVPADHMVVMTSRLETTAGPMHVPMLDFKLESKRSNDRAAREVAGRLGNGYLLDSGSSYHFYGSDLLPDDALQRWLLRAQLLSRYVDTRWVTHQLLEGRCALRISPSASTHQQPVVIAEIGATG
jgi:hypothetical protein